MCCSLLCGKKQLMVEWGARHTDKARSDRANLARRNEIRGKTVQSRDDESLKHLHPVQIEALLAHGLSFPPLSTENRTKIKVHIKRGK